MDESLVATAIVVVLYFLLSLWLVNCVFDSCLSLQRYEVRHRSIEHYNGASPKYFCWTSSNVAVGDGHVLNTTVDYPSVYSLVLLAREIRGNATVTIVAYGSP